jgi:hypothetical protein
MLVKGRAFRSFQISQKVRIVRKTRSLIFFFGIETHQSFVTLLEKGLVVECAPQSGVALVSSDTSWRVTDDHMRCVIDCLFSSSVDYAGHK